MALLRKKTIAATPPQTTLDQCQPCNYEGKQIPATKYYCDCEELLCTSCVIVHGKFKANRLHRIVDRGDRNVQMRSAQGGIQENEYCKEHPDKMLMYKCDQHRTLICANCVVKDHSWCKVIVVTELSRKFDDSLDTPHGELSTLSLDQAATPTPVSADRVPSEASREVSP